MFAIGKNDAESVKAENSSKPQKKRIEIFSPYAELYNRGLMLLFY